MFCALAWDDHEPPRRLRGRLRPARSGRRTTGSTGSTTASSRTTPGAPICSARALTLKGLTYAPTGALAGGGDDLAARDTGRERNWDYRYSWIRDSSFALWAFHTLGFEWEANDFFQFVTDAAAEGDGLQVCTEWAASAARREGAGAPPRL